MWPFDYFKKKREREEAERRHQEVVARQRAERERIQRQKAEQERQRKIQEEKERQDRLRAQREQAASMQPFVFKSNCHQRYEHSHPAMGLQECMRTVSVVKNTNGCSGYKIQPGDGYIVKIFNDDLNKPNMADKPMRIVKKTETSVELRGYTLEAQTPFGWQEFDLSDYGLLVHYEHGKVSKCVLHMYDRDTFIEYRIKNDKPLETVNAGATNECEQYAKLARQAAENGNTSMAHQYGLKVYNSIINNKAQIHKLNDTTLVALSLGKLLEGDYFQDNDSIKRVVGITYYLLTKAIKESSNRDPYLYVYRFSTVWEYNKVFYHLFAHAAGTEYDPNPFMPFGQMETMKYDHDMQGMQMADVLTEPKVLRLDPALGNIFNQMYAQYRTTPSEQIITLGNKYHDGVFNYLKGKIEALDFDF